MTTESERRRATSILRFFATLSMLMGFGALLVWGYYEDKLSVAPTRPDSTRGYVEGVNYKGATHYISVTEAKAHRISFQLAAGGIGAGVLLGLVWYALSWPRQ